MASHDRSGIAWILIHVIARILILAIGVMTGVLMYLRMAFMHFEGCSGILDYTNTKIGLVGSVLILIGGIVGAGLNRWVALLPGTIVILIAWASAYSLLWILIVVLVVLLCYRFIPQQQKQEEMQSVHSYCLINQEKERARFYV